MLCLPNHLSFLSSQTGTTSARGRHALVRACIPTQQPFCAGHNAKHGCKPKLPHSMKFIGQHPPDLILSQCQSIHSTTTDSNNFQEAFRLCQIYFSESLPNLPASGNYIWSAQLSFFHFVFAKYIYSESLPSLSASGNYIWPARVGKVFGPACKPRACA